MRLTEAELDDMNTAAALLELAKKNMSRVWTPIRQKFSLPSKCTYDRITGIISTEETDDRG